MGLRPGDIVTSFQRFILSLYQQDAIWLQRIMPEMAGVIQTVAWDEDRKQPIAFSDGTYGVGLQIVDGRGITHNGYLAPQSIPCGVADRARLIQITDRGMVPYEGPAVRYQPPVVLNKLDVLVLQDGRRFVIGDRLRPFQMYGQTTESIAKLEYREPGDIVYQIPTT